MEALGELLSCTNCLAKNDTIRSLGYSECETLSVLKSRTQFKKGQHIFVEGNMPSGLYCMQTGKVKIFKLRDDGRQQIVRFAGPGDFLGYRSVLSQEHYRASAIALEESSMCFIPTKTLFDLLEKNAGFSLKIIRNLASDLRKAENHLIYLSEKTVRERIASTLLMLHDKFGADKSNTLNIQLSRREIGDIANTSVETTIRVLSALNKEDVIEIQGKKLVLTNIKKLHQIAEMATIISED